MLHPAQRICCSKEYLFYAISGTIFQYNTRTHEIKQIWKALPITNAEKAKNIEHRAIIEMALYSHVLVWFGEDKFLRVYDLETCTELPERELVKRACALNVDDNTIIVGDKFGDVYVYPVIPATTIPAERITYTQTKDEEVSNVSPILGHVSMLTSVLMTPKVQGKRYIISADRDEHIRISNFPDGYDIEAFCLGHEQFISSLLLPSSRPGTLISAGGDDYIVTWDWRTGNLLRKDILHEAVDLARSEDRGFAILKILHLAPVDLIVVLVEGVKALFLCSLNHDKEKTCRRVELKGPALDISVSESTIWITYDTQQASSSDTPNFEAIEYIDGTIRHVDLKLLNHACQTIVDKVEYTTYRADLMRKRTKIVLETAKLAVQQNGVDKHAHSPVTEDSDLKRKIEDDRESTSKKLKINGTGH